jgi:fructokinase
MGVMTDDVLVIGESLVDIVRTADGATIEHPGGSAANVAVALARLGRPVRFATGFADDERGRLLLQHLSGSGVTLAGDPHTLPRTSTALADIGPDGSAEYAFDVEWRLPEVDPGRPRFVHVCSIGAVLPPGADAVLALLERLPAESTVCYDVNARPALTGAGPELVARVERVARRSHVVKASDEDLATLYPDLDVDMAAERLLTLGPAAVAVTRGAEGASWLSLAGRVAMDAVPVAVVDTIGAGDTFAAGIVDALWDDVGDPGEILGRAARAAAVTVSRPGADPPYRRELDPYGAS